MLAAKTITVHGCTVVVRAVKGPEYQELFLSCQPEVDCVDVRVQADAAYLAIESVLGAFDGSGESIIRETVFYRDLQLDRNAVRDARGQRFKAQQGVPDCAITEIQQPPLDPRLGFELSVEAVVSLASSVEIEAVTVGSECDCAECAALRGLVISSPKAARFYSGALYGQGADAYEQTHALFETAERMLQKAEMNFSDVMRTWIYLPHMERDYPKLNKARREFFNQHNVDPIPASTGIGAGLVADSHSICMSVYAVKGADQIVKTVMTTPTLNEAPQYGADFSRGMRVCEPNKQALYVSGTASLNEAGESVYSDDFNAQADRMLVNIKTLLAAQGAGFNDIAYAHTYLKHLADAEQLKVKLTEAGFAGFANNVVVAPVCRPELLCEAEVVALVPLRP